MLEIENLQFNVKEEGGSFDIIKDISLKVPDGKLVVITGPNGGGKSTLAKLIMGVRKPTGGKIIFALVLPGVGYDDKWCCDDCQCPENLYSSQGC